MSRQDIINGLKISQIAAELEIKIEKTQAGNFNYKCKCPSYEHKGGNEQNSSCYIDDENNNFYCFTCGAGSDVIAFYKYAMQCSYSEAYAALRGRVTASSSSAPAEFNNYYILSEISHTFRKALKKHPKEQEWIHQLIQKTNPIIDKLDSKDYETSRKLLEKIQKTIERKFA